MTLTFICAARAARRPTSSGDVRARSGQDVTKSSVGTFGKRSKVYLLVILHYLLKNNITFMWGMEQGKIPPEGVNGNRVTGIGLLTRGRLGGLVR
jgi:hypothetical protein